jgi:glycosyltransferase involved in cell wall biosynthesis
MTAAPPDLSIVIPVYNRGEIIRYTLESIDRASAGLAVETIVVDDGSDPPTATVLEALHWQPTRLVRQGNRGLLYARLAGLEVASGRHVLFLDSDDLIGPEKLRRQIEAMDRTGVEVSYTDTSRCELAGPYADLAPVVEAPLADASGSAEFFITVQPVPHAPIFRTDHLRAVVAGAFFPPSPLYNPVAEIWFYHNAALWPARVLRVPGPHTVMGIHAGARLTNHWERLGVASLAVMEAFARSAPDTPATAEARWRVGARAFGAWRRLPRGFAPEFGERLLNVWRRLGPDRSPELGGRGFQAAVLALGAERAGRWFRGWQARPYAASRTMPDEAFAGLMRALPPP